MPAPKPPPTRPREYTIDELAAVSRVASRTIRYYQSKGLLPRPVMRGRVAFYDDAHVERLRLVEDLQARGLQIKAIVDIVHRLDEGELALSAWLGIEDRLREPWANDRPKIVEEKELAALLGTSSRERIAELVRGKLLERRGDAYLVTSTALLNVGLKLAAAGVPASVALDAQAILRKHLAGAAADLATFFLKHAELELAQGADAGRLAAVVEALRSAANEAVRVIFAQEIEREIRRLVETGQLAELTRKARR